MTASPPPQRRRLRRFRVLAALIVLYAGVMLFGGCADKLLLYPSTMRVDLPGVERVDAPDKTLEIFKTRPAPTVDGPPGAFVLAFTGNAGRAEYEAQQVADEWRDQPVEIWAMNYPGYGSCAGPATLKSIPVAALRAFDELSAVAAGRPIYLSGQSLGTTAALYVASQRAVAGLVLKNPPPLRGLVMSHGWWNLWLLAGPVALHVPSQLDSVVNGTAVRAPAIFLLAQQDTIVPPEYQRQVLNAYAGQAKVIDLLGADHNDPLGAESQAQLSDAIRLLMQSKR